MNKDNISKSRLSAVIRPGVTNSNVSAREVRYHANELDIPLDEIPAGALIVCKTLQQHGYDGYLVGGCVRDWILGFHPKDFDVVTNARPEQIKPLFKRAYIIGRRFKLVHVYHKREMIEVATYRAAPGNNSKHHKNSQHHKQSDSGRVLRDNVYGTIAEDAVRRDFTINALYFDPVSQEIIDYQGGIDDLQNHHLELIGDPKARFAEDPVRMLRALRFSAKLNFELPQAMIELISHYKHHFKEVSNARLFDETFKLFHHAHAIRSWDILSENGFISILFPLTARAIKRDEKLVGFILQALKNTDIRVAQSKPVIPAYFFAVVLWHAYQQQRRDMPNLPRDREGVYHAAEQVYRKQYPSIAIPKRVSSIITEIWDMQWHLEKRRAQHINDLLDNRRFRAAYDFMLLREWFGEVDPAITTWWTRIQDMDDEEVNIMIGDLPKPHYPKRGRRKHPR